LRNTEELSERFAWLAATRAAVYTLASLLALFPGGGCSLADENLPPDRLLCVSYDTTRELFQDYNIAFAEYWRKLTGRKVTILQSHGASGIQARAVISGLEADVVTLVVPYDIDSISRESGKISPGWRNRLPHNSSPFYSTIVFLVRKGNPKRIADWPDLARPGISVIAPNPKTSGAARWIYLAAWGSALRHSAGDEAEAAAFVSRLYGNMPILDKGSRASTMTFVKRKIGDVLITWESEAFLAIKEFSTGEFEIIAPPVSIYAELSVAVVDAVVDRRGSRRIAEEYLRYLFSPAGQEIAARNHFRPHDAGVAEKFARNFPRIDFLTVAELFGSWEEAQRVHFSDGGTFDLIYRQRKED